MTDTLGWDPRFGPTRPRKVRPVLRFVKRSAAFLQSLGRSAADPARGAAILAYHSTEPDRSHPWWVDFEGQMALISDLGYRVAPLDEVVAAVRAGSTPAEPLLAITFDDGWANNLAEAFPELARRGWPATVFIVSSYLGRRPYVSAEEVRSLSELGISVGNHTHTHAELTALPDAAIAGELEQCSLRLRDLTGSVPSCFCYPNGSYSPRVRSAVEKAGFAGACSGRVGANLPGADPLLLRRLTIEPREGPRDMKWRLAGGYDFLDRRQAHMDREGTEFPGRGARRLP